MNNRPITHSNSDAAIERALLYALRLIEKMEASAAPDRLIYVPEVMVWAIEQLKPSLLAPLRQTANFTHFCRCLELYGKIRPEAAELRFNAFLVACGEAGVGSDYGGYLAAEDILHALTNGSRPASSSSELKILERVLTLAIQHKQRDTSSTPAVNRLPPAVHSYDIESDLDALLRAREATSHAPYLLQAMRHARRELIKCDDGSDGQFWSKTYPQVVADWLEIDLPDVAASIQADETVSEYVHDYWAYINLMREVERVWDGVSYPVRALLVRCIDEQEALDIVQAIVRADGTNESNVPDCAALVWSMIRRREAWSGIRAANIAASAATNEYIERIRTTPSSYENCFVTDTQTLPVDVRQRIEEKTALVVRLPESWLSDVDLLAENTGLQCFFSEHAVSKEVRCELTMSPAFWCEYDQLWPVMFAFRRCIPVVIVFEEVCVVCNFAFRHFSDLRDIADLSPRHYPTNIIADDGTYCHWRAGKPVRVQPSILKTVVNDSCYRGIGDIAKSYLAGHPDAALNFVEKMLRTLSSEPVRHSPLTV